MSIDSRILSALFRVAFFLLATGMIGKATMFIAHEALTAHKSGFVSYRAINKALTGKTRKSRP